MLKNRICLSIFIFLHCLLPTVMWSQQHSQDKTEGFFDDVLLLINFNHPYYDNIPFLKEIYGPYFKNIVFYGEVPHPEVNVIAHNLGWYVHQAITDAMIRWPNFKGYICCQDDCFMNFWNYPRLDKNKIWFHQYWTASLNSPTHWWIWWNYSCGYASAICAYNKLAPHSLATLEANCGSQQFAFSWSDFLYIPAKYREEFILTSQAFNHPNVFIEIALPTIVLCLESYNNIEKLQPCWNGTNNSIDLSTYQPSFDWVHPIKLSVPANREFLRQTVANHKNK